MSSISQTLTVVLLSAAPAFGCGKPDADSASADSAAAADSAAMAGTDGDTATSPAATGTAGSTDASSRPLTVADIDRWQKGMTGEMQAVQEVAAKMKTAQTTEDKLSIMMEMEEGATAAAGAQAAGLDEERYKFARSKLSDVVSYLAPLELEAMDTTAMPQNQRDQFRTERDAYLKRVS
jgi:hypothetical protein